ncbi:TonB-dependent siderophore receptor [Massilia sp. Dwa41.01b]|uniref:TonB-dependent receptor n=1 Tax=unclassified Massilia TaxID=2609279 RepID=UPI0016007DAE|nr:MULTISPECIES: TonB-dependent siderophore receptor [unclassified Massilia]QNA89850.1 TonB-dependent siderophore receptor [Massilia sp. Dwa41.01b]QNB00741.1 TonB-dependent siderophore receptor [Massilia sp. Se16.2.3]
MTKTASPAVPRANSFIRSRKHVRLAAPCLGGSALAVLASLAAPLAHADGAKDIDPTIPVVEVSGANRRDVQAPVMSSSDKFTAPLLDTPKSVTVIGQEVISQTAAVTLTDALRTVPGITIGAGEGGNPVGDNVFIRGYNAQTDTYVDGIRDAGSQSREIFNLEQVEVVKGPNSAYGGRSSAGGGINLVSKSAKLENFSNATVGLGTDQYRRITTDINRSLGDNAAFRLNLMTHENDVAGRDVVGGERWGIAPTVSFGLNGPTKATLSYYHMESSEIPDTGIPFNNPFASGPNLPLNGNGTPLNVDRETFYGLANRDFRDTRSDIGTVDLRHEFSPNLVLRNVTRYGKTKNDFVWTQPDDSKGNTVLYGTVWRRANTRVTETETAANTTALSGKLTTAGIKHSYNIGVEFSREEVERSSYLFTPGTNNPLTGTFTCPTSGANTLYNCAPLHNPNPYDPWVYTRSVSPALTKVKTDTRAVYGFDTIEFNPQWLLNLGARWDDFKTALDVNATATAAATHARVDTSFDTYQAGLVFKPSSNGSIYVSYATSATPPGNDGGDGLDALSVAVQNLQPQESKNWELGTKWEVLRGRLSLNAALFQSKMNNARVTAPDGTTQNVGKKELKGVELGFSGKLTNAWQVFGGYTWLDAVLVDNGYLNVGTTAAPVYVASPYSGNVFPSTPKHSASLWSSYAVNKDFSFGIGMNYVDKVYANVNNTKHAPGYTRFDAMASYNLNKSVSFQLNVQNLTDKLYFDRVSSPHYAGVGPGRSASLTANLKF